MKFGTLRRPLLGLLALAWLLGVAHADNRFTVSANGQEVVDTKSGLTWRRCSEGQTWSGSTCTGSAGFFTFAQALTRAQTQTGWRLPNLKELGALADKGRNDPAIDTTAFPGTPSEWFWTSTPLEGSPGYAWGVDFYSGNTNIRSDGLRLRLVR